MTTIAGLLDSKTAKSDLVQKTIHLLIESSIAEETFSQIIDGKPTAASYVENYGRPQDLDGSEPLAPSLQAVQDFRKICSDFRIRDALVDEHAVKDYINAPPESALERRRLLEIIATIIHNVARDVYVRFHPQKDLFPKERPRYDCFSPTAHFWVDLYHRKFKDY